MMVLVMTMMACNVSTNTFQRCCRFALACASVRNSVATAAHEPVRGGNGVGTAGTPLGEFAGGRDK